MNESQVVEECVSAEDREDTETEACKSQKVVKLMDLSRSPAGIALNKELSSLNRGETHQSSLMIYQETPRMNELSLESRLLVDLVMQSEDKKQTTGNDESVSRLIDVISEA